MERAVNHARGKALQQALGITAKKLQVTKVPPKKESTYKKDKYIEGYYPPRLDVTDKDFPNITSLKVGETVNLAIAAEVTGIRTYDRDGTKKVEATLEVKTIGQPVAPKGAGA